MVFAVSTIMRRVFGCLLIWVILTANDYAIFGIDDEGGTVS